MFTKKSYPHVAGRINCLLTAVFTVIALTGFAGANRYVSPSGSDGNNGLTPATAKKTLPNSLATAGDGDIIHVANGTYLLTATLNFNHELSFIGESESGVIINATAVSGVAWALNPNKSNTSLSNFTIIPNGTSTGGFPIHVSANTGNPLPVISNISLSHITINGARKTAFDYNGVDNLTISYLTATNTTNGNGIQFSGCKNVNAGHLTTSGNAWGGVAVYVSKVSPGGVGRGSDNVVIDASNSSLGETTSVYIQDELGFVSTHTTVLGLDYMVRNPYSAGFSFYYADKATALATAVLLPGSLVHYPELSTIQQVSSNNFIVFPGLTIQAAINAASPGNIIKVYPGNYIESAPNSVLFNGSTYTFGLFVSAAKSGISIMGVDAAGLQVNSYSSVTANVQANATNNFGPSGVFVEGDNVTITGLNIFLNPAGNQNKTVELIGENFTMKFCRLSDGNSLYINDWRYNTATDASYITRYLIEGNKFEAGTSLDISSGAGKSGAVNGRQILNNYFDAAGGYWTMVSFNGSGTGVPWFNYSVGGAIIMGNQFVNGEQYIRHRGTVDNSQFNWNQYWNNNSFEKSVITLADEASFTPRAYSYPGSYGTFNNVKRIGAIIQNDITQVANNGDLVKIGAGTFVENITVTKELEIRGQSEALTQIIPAVSNPNCGGGGGGSLCAGASNIILVQANNVTIDRLSLDGNNPALTSGSIVDGVDIDARNGIITNHALGTPFTNLNVNHVTVKNIYLRGIYASTKNGTFNFNNNSVSNVQGDAASIALFNYNGSGSFTNNTVTDANDAIASNWSKGTIYSGNIITNSGSGIHTDNNGGEGGNADLIQNNQVYNSMFNGYGIWVFAPFRSVTVKDNIVSNVDVGLASAGQQTDVTSLFTGNTVDGQNNPNSTGAYFTTNLFGFGTANLSVNFQNNMIRNTVDGIYLESEAGPTLTISANSNSITGNSHSNVTQGVGILGAGVFNADMKCNWWGTAEPVAIAATITGTSTDHSTWLSNGNDSDPSAPGFQPSGICGISISNARVTTLKNVLCYGSSNGSVTIAFDNGFFPVSYAVDGGPVTVVNSSPFTISGLVAGVYSVMITDGAGIASSVNFNITQPAAAIAANFTFTPILCNGGLSTQNVTITGGTAPYTMANQNGGIFITGAQTGILYGGNTGNTYAANYIYTVTDANGCQYVFTENITQPAPITVNYSNTPILCHGGLSIESITINGGKAPYTVTNQGGGALVIGAQAGVTYHGNTYAANYTYTVTDANGCRFTFTSTISDPAVIPAPVIAVGNANAFCNKLTLTASSTITPASYSWVSTNNPGSFSSNSQFSLGQSNNDGNYYVFVKDNTTGCISATSAVYNFQKQNLANNYTIIAYKEVELGEYNKVNTGSVGVLSSKGEAEFKKYSSVASPGSFVKAVRIDKAANVTILQSINAAATPVLPAMIYNTANTKSLPNYEVKSGTATLSGNYGNLNIKKGSTVTLTGTTFGTIHTEEGAQLTFTQPTVNIDQLQIDKGSSTAYSNVHFAPNSKVLVSKSVRIGDRVVLNPENYKVTFYVGGLQDTKKNDDDWDDEAKFTVNGKDIRVTVNVMMPMGRLKVTGGDENENGNNENNKKTPAVTTYINMTGLFIGTEIESQAKNVIWNSYDCSAAGVSLTNTPTFIESPKVEKIPSSISIEEGLKVTVMPNPTITYFTLKLESKYETPVNIQVMDAGGRKIDTRSKIGSNSTIQIGHNYSSGTYFVELIQGTKRTIVELVKGKG